MVVVVVYIYISYPCCHAGCHKSYLLRRHLLLFQFVLWKLISVDVGVFIKRLSRREITHH